MPQTIQLSDEQRTEKGRDFIRLIEDDMRHRSFNISKRKIVRDLYHGSQQRPLEYPGQTDIHLHVMTEKIEGIVPKIVNSFWNADPIVHVKRIADEFDEKRTNDNERFLNWAIEADIPNLAFDLASANSARYALF